MIKLKLDARVEMFRNSDLDSLEIKDTIEIVAEVEQLPAHKNSASMRFKNYE